MIRDHESVVGQHSIQSGYSEVECEWKNVLLRRSGNQRREVVMIQI